MSDDFASPRVVVVEGPAQQQPRQPQQQEESPPKGGKRRTSKEGSRSGRASPVSPQQQQQQQQQPTSKPAKHPKKPAKPKPVAAAPAPAPAAAAAVAVEPNIEAEIVLALKEIQEHRLRIRELEGRVDALAASYGIDPDSLFAENQRLEDSEPGTIGAANPAAPPPRWGLRLGLPPPLPQQASLRAAHQASHSTTSSSMLRGKGRVHPEPGATSSDAASVSSSGGSGSTVPGQLRPAHSMFVVGVGRRPSVDSDEKVRRIMRKLQQITGRRESLEEISPLLNAHTADEAYENGRMIRAADHFKRVLGNRPAVMQHSALAPAASEATDSTSAERPSTSPGTSAEDASTASSAVMRNRRRSRSQNALPMQYPDRKIDKLTRLTGRRSSLAEIIGLLDPQTPDEARTNAQSLYQMEHLKKRFGQRPSLSQAKKTASFETVAVSPRSASAAAAAVPKSPSMPSLSSTDEVAVADDAEDDDAL